VPGPRAARAALHAALGEAGVPLARQGSAVRVLVLAGALVLALAGLTLARVALKLSATALVAAPVTWLAAALVVLAIAWLFWRTR
jgi:hypothetical protein